jgi:molybdenum cofactor cytidylyltransferase
MSNATAGLAILILGAGRGTRMRGGDKLLEMVAGQPLLRHLAQMALQLNRPVYVVLPRDGAPKRRAALRGLPVRIVKVPEAETGMAASLVAGVAALSPDCTGLMLLLGDMPEITGEDMALLADAFEKTGGTQTVRGATPDGVAGHPVIFPAALLPELASLDGDKGAASLLLHEQVKLVALPGAHAIRDLDTPEDWANWRAEK